MSFTERLCLSQKVLYQRFHHEYRNLCTMHLSGEAVLFLSMQLQWIYAPLEFQVFPLMSPCKLALFAFTGSARLLKGVNMKCMRQTCNSQPTDLTTTGKT